ncbi:MAG: arylsulfatase [Planctomycetaceae bacterium]
MKRSLALLAVLLTASIDAPGSAGADRPNVIVVITDDQGYGDLSCHGNPVLETPHLDRLHDESIRLTDFHVAPMCTPTRGQLMTGVDCLRNGAMNVSSGRTLLRRGIPTLADAFAAADYATGHFGKWHLGDNYPYRPQDRGFDESLWFPSSHIGSAPDFWNNDYFDDVYSHSGERRPYKGYCTDVFFREALTWMKARAEGDRPFLCYIATNAPHGPLFVPAEYRERYEAKGMGPNIARFFGMIANIDDNIGRLDGFLRASGLAENTVLVFLTDNGGTVGVSAFNAGMRGHKVDLYEGGHRVPCFIRWPAGGLRDPGDVDELTQVQDLMPTLLDLCGIAKPAAATFDGISLAPLLQGTTDTLPDRMLMIQFSRMNGPEPQKDDACILWNRWRLVGGKELFDLAADPDQQANVIAENSKVAESMQKEYDRWWGEVAPRVNEHESIVVGSAAENPLTLSPSDWEDVFLDQGRQIRMGLARNGAWNIEVAQAGDYEITLRRWPDEADAPIRAGLPPVEHADGEFLAGVALPAHTARLQVGEFDARQAIGETDEGVNFSVSLPAGPTELKATLLDKSDHEIAGAYFVTVRRR